MTTRCLQLLLAALLVGIGAAASVAQGADSSTSGTNGRIIYGVELKPDQYQLVTIRPDGSGRKQITHGSGSSLNADWSPNGRSVVYELDQANSARIAIAEADGSGRRILTPTGFQGQPSFSPDGKWIAYERDLAPGNNGVWLMRADGTQQRRVTRNPFVKTLTNGVCGCDTDPNFSPNGKWITFVRLKKDEEQQALFAVRPDGSGLHRLTPYSSEVAIKHDWSPDGKLIVLTENADFVRPTDSANIVTIKPDGSGRTQLTLFADRKENGFVGSFSPDGKQIVFRLEQGDKYALAVIDRDGGNMRLITKPSLAKPRFIDWGTHQ